MEEPQYLKTEHQWADLILHQSVSQQLDEFKQRAKEQGRCHALFYGPPGTGKTLAGALLGKELGRDIVRIDLSAVFSKYIGETEKNLNRLCERAESKAWILFFDEADALFGKRTEVKDSHDRYANQELSYLLQRIEEYSGIVVLATNRKDNIDDAFIRRFKYVIHFPIPEPQERLRLWQNAFRKHHIPATINLDGIANQYPLTGGSIVAIANQFKQPGESIASDVLLQKVNASLE